MYNMEIHVAHKTETAKIYRNIEVTAVYVSMMKLIGPQSVSMEHIKHLFNLHKVKL